MNKHATWTVCAATVALLGAVAYASGTHPLTHSPTHHSLSVQGRPLPETFRNVISARKAPTAREVAQKNVLTLDTAMMDLYDDALATYKQNLRDKSPIVIALFTSQGGEMTLYRPGKEPLKAPPVPVVYQLAKSVSHSSLAIFEMLAPYLENPSDPSWRRPMEGYRLKLQAALDGLDALDMARDDREVLRLILTRNIAFIDQCLKDSTFTYAQLEQYGRGLWPSFQKTIGLASRLQVSHWMDVLTDWKKMLGKDWDKTYGVTNTLYVTRQNHILFTVMVQFFGRDAIGDRLFLFETPSFFTEQATMLDVLTRIVADRAVGEIYFKDGYVMDAELIGGGARKAIIEETTKRGIKPVIPPLARFKSNAWPWATDPSTGTGPSTLDDIK